MEMHLKKCLIVVDYQNDFVSGSLGFPGADALDGPIAGKIALYHAGGDEVIFTLDTHEIDYLQKQEGQNLPVEHCIKGTLGHELFGKTAQAAWPQDKKFIKYTFGSDALYEYLKANPFQSIELAGLVSNICVISNAVLAKTAQPETPLMVDARCTASHDADLNQAALDVMASLQVQILNRS